MTYNGACTGVLRILDIAINIWTNNNAINSEQSF